LTSVTHPISTISGIRIICLSPPLNGDPYIRESVRQPLLLIDVLISGKLSLEMELAKVYGVSPPCIIAASKLAVINL